MSDKVSIKPKQARILRELEEVMGIEIQPIKEFSNENQRTIHDNGVVIKKNNIVGLKLAKDQDDENNRIKPDYLDSLPESIGQLKFLRELDLFLVLGKFPESFGNLKALKTFILKDSQFSSLPESFGKLKSLQILELGCQLKKVPESFGQLKSLRELTISSHVLQTLPESFGNLLALQKLDLSNNQLKSLPESFGNLRSLQVLNLEENSLTTLPDSFGNLKSLQTLKLSGNQTLSNLPACIKSLKNLRELDLRNCGFTEIPSEVWALTQLQNFPQLLSGNPLRKEEEELRQRYYHTLDPFLKHLRERATIRIFLSHAVSDFKPYHLKELVTFLEQQKEISEVIHCEEDLKGNIDEWMFESVISCQLMLFLASKKSVFDSPDCRKEIELADRYGIPCIPIKTEEVEWSDLAELVLAGELGLPFKQTQEPFYQEIYEYICELKRKVNLMEREERKVGFSKIYEHVRIMYEGLREEFQSKYSNLENELKTLKKDLKLLASKIKSPSRAKRK